MVLADSHRISPVPCYSGCGRADCGVLPTGLSPSMERFSNTLGLPFSRARKAVLRPCHGLNHGSLGCSPFARRYLGNHCCFLFLRLLRCFSWPGLLSDTRPEYHVFNVVGCPIRTSPDRRLFAPPRGLSQLIASFVATESQGIRHAPFDTFLSTVR